MPATHTGLTLVTAPEVEPVSLAEARLHLRSDDSVTTDDELITSLIVAARQSVESRTNRALVTQTWDAFYEAFPDDRVLLVPKPTLQSVTSVKYRDGSNVEQTLASTEYDTDVSSLPGVVSRGYSKTWPTTYERPQAVTVRFVAGYGLAASVPDAIKAAMKLMMGHWYANREAVVTGTISTALEMTVDALLGPYRYVEAI